MAPTPNATSFFYYIKGISAPGTAEQLPSYRIPDGLPFTLMARRSNTQNVYLGDTQDHAQTSGNRKVLVPGQSTTLEIDDLSRIWVDADNANDKLEVTVQRIPSTS